MNFGPQTGKNLSRVFTHPHCFVPALSIAHPLSGINVAPHDNFEWATNCRGHCAPDNIIWCMSLHPLILFLWTDIKSQSCVQDSDVGIFDLSRMLMLR